MREYTLTVNEEIMLRGLRAREEQLQDAGRLLASDQVYVLHNLAARLEISESELGGRYQINVKQGVLIDTYEDADAASAHPSDHGS